MSPVKFTLTELGSHTCTGRRVPRTYSSTLRLFLLLSEFIPSSGPVASHDSTNETSTVAAEDDKGYGVAKDGIEMNQCCSPGKEQSKQDACCSAQEESTGLPTSQDAPDCCKGKPSPCCDSTCIDRLALRECQSGKASPSSSTTSLINCHRGRAGKPCIRHYRTARQHYQAKLDALGCICRALLALGQKSCCVTNNSPSLGGKESWERLSSTSSVDESCQRGNNTCERESKATSAEACAALPTEAVDKGYGNGYCATKKAVSVTPPCDHGCCTEARAPSITGSCTEGCCGNTRPPSIAGSCKEGCCTIMEPPSRTGSCKDECCGPVTPKSTGDSCKGGCCGGGKEADDIIGVPDQNNVELEKGASEQEHVILSISGMTCTGCETKLRRTLNTLPAVCNLRTSLVLARAEFDLTAGKFIPEDVIKHLERTTEFKCERLNDQGSTLDVVCSGDPHRLINGDWPKGVTDLKQLNKTTISVSFDPSIVGARDLIQSGWPTPLQLAPQRADRTLDAGSRHVRHVGYMTILSAIFTIPVLVLSWAPLPPRPIAHGSASLALATLVQVLVAGPFYPKALKALVFSRVIEMDLLIVLSTSTAYIFSIVSFGYEVSGNPLSTGEFFETSTLLVTLIMVGRYVAALARQKAVESISIRSLQANSAILVHPFRTSVCDAPPSKTILREQTRDMHIDARLLQMGDIFKVPPHTRISTDGTVISGLSSSDESMITGESLPVEKSRGSTVIAGSLNLSGTLNVKLTRLPGDNTISTIAAMVDEAKLSKPKIQDIADRVASFFVPVIVALTITTFVIWIAVGIAVRKQSGADATVQAITYAITVLIVSCPCAIGLAVPMVIVIASGVAAEKGVVFKGAEAMELAHQTTDVVFDKTGTLTKGKLGVVIEDYAPSTEEDAEGMILALVRDNKHPVSAAVASHLVERGISPAQLVDIKSVPGKGLEGRTLTNRSIRAGNSRWLECSEHPLVIPIPAQGLTAFCITVDSTLVAVFGLENTLRADASSTIATLHSLGITTHVLSGDDTISVEKVASALEIPSANVRAKCLPRDKQEYIKQLLATPLDGKQRTVIFLGDGTNDAPSLALATIGMHMCSDSSSDIAQAAADVVLMRPALSGVLTAINVSKKAMRRVAFNFGWSFVYNLFAILLGAGAFVTARIPPAYAGLGELVSVLPVVAAAVLLRWSKV
ncbi:heavy metal translocatin [Lophiostoma macrostomum CBS 122681]|uniref:Heavy metal translocatin n=1 Tax=Lophiostoma macrostomum CBS 122681 TaxID=1314788 RepID=A0A6A6SZJ1_9PLEO|nr:heavy metal translocatin [Lophiostoma macrostomum CBS 122681]